MTDATLNQIELERNYEEAVVYVSTNQNLLRSRYGEDSLTVLVAKDGRISVIDHDSDELKLIGRSDKISGKGIRLYITVDRAIKRARSLGARQ